MFYNDLDLLEFRLELLYEKVDGFIIVEADVTHQGKPKPLYFQENKARFAWAEKKMHHYVFSPNTEGLDFTSKPEGYDPAHDCWQIEYQQRNAIADIAKQFPEDYIVIIGDEDEIPSYEAIELIRNEQVALPLACKQDLFYYNLSNLCNQDWRGSIFTTVKHLLEVTPQKLRERRNALPAISDGGWHLSWFGSITKKLESTSHQELNTSEFNNEEHIKKCLDQRKDLFNRDIGFIEVGDWFFPEYFNTKLRGRFRG